MGIRLDPLSRDLHGQNAELRARGPVVPVELPGGVPAWSVTRYRLLREVLGDPRFSSDPRHWRALREGEIPPGWPLLDFVTVPGMLTADGAEHRRLRTVVARAFTPRRVAGLRGDVARITAARLADVAAAIDREGRADLVDLFAWPLPLAVVSQLIGFPAAAQPELHRRALTASSSLPGPEEKTANSRALHALVAAFVAARRAGPGDDLTSALLAEDGELTDGEVVGTLLTLLVAGHGTVTKLLVNAVRQLLADRSSLRLVLSGERPWGVVVEETLRFDSPLGHFPMRYAVDDVVVGGVRIPAGDPVILSFAAVGRDAETYGERAGRFDLRSAPAPHLSFGHGAHFCLGAPLARLEAEVALPALFTRFPALRALEESGPVPSILANSVAHLYVG